MAWTAPPRGSRADRVLDALGQLGRPDWEVACRWCPGWDAAGTKRLAEEAARGGEARVAWYVPALAARDVGGEAGSASPPKKVEVRGKRGVRRKRGRPRTDTGQRAYQLKARGGRTWSSIARELGLSDKDKGAVAKVMARRHAQREGLPWPV